MTVDRGTRPARRAVPSSRPPGVDLAPDAADESVTRPVPEATVARLAVYLRVLTVPARRRPRHRVQRGARRGRRGQLREAPQGPLPHRLLRCPRRRVRRLPPDRRGRGDARPGQPARRGARRGRQPRARARRLRRVRPARLPGRGPLRRRPGAGRHRRSTASRCSTPTRSPRVCAERGVTIGVVATPAEAAQRVCDHLVSAGVRSILNFAPTVLAVPAGVEVRKVDLAVEMQVLSFHVARRHGTVPAAASPPPRRDRPRERCSPDEPAPGRRLAPHRRGARARARRRVPRGHPQGPRRPPHRRARHRGDAGLHLQPRGDLRGGRDLPRRPHRGLERAGPPRARRGLRPHRPPLRALRRLGRGAPVLGGRGPRLDGRGRGPDPRPAPRVLRRRPRARLGRAGRCTSWPSRRCGSASAPTPRPASTPRAPRWSPRPSPTPRPRSGSGWPDAARSWSAPGRWAP